MSFGAQISMEDLHRVRPAIYWSDLLAACVTGWGAFALAILAPPFSLLTLAATVLAIFLLYRALCFIHEISHHGAKLPGFEPAWNALVGFPLMLPAFTYGEAHFDHHRLGKYGTEADPEYLPFARSAFITAWFTVSGPLLPLLLTFRFVILAPIGLIFPAFQKILVERASAIAMNPKYLRPATPEIMRKIRRDSLIFVAFMVLALALLALAPDRLRIVMTWFVILAVIHSINNWRALAAHLYESNGQQMDKAGQVLDSVDVPSGILTELWAPVGLRYHAVHHCFPGIPYHALPSAYRRLMNESPASYGRMTRSGLFQCLGSLFAKAYGTS